MTEPKSITRVEGMPECEFPPKQIIVYLCLTPECPNYYAATDFRPDRSDIETMQHHRSQNDGSQVSSHPRVECPDCRIQFGIHVDRVPYVVTEVVPLEEVRKALTKAAEKARKKVKKAEAANAKSG